MAESDRKYIVIDPGTWAVSLADDIPEAGAVIPLTADMDLHPEISKVVYYRVLYRSVHKRDEQEGRLNVNYKLVEPDPWLIALGFVMWEGIIQGLTWDVVKANVKLVLGKLRKLRVAPPELSSGSFESTRAKSNTKLGFRWTEYSSDGDKQREMFLGLERTHNRASQRGRDTITDSTSAESLRKRVEQARELKTVSLPTRDELKNSLDPYEELSEELREQLCEVFDPITRDIERRLRTILDTDKAEQKDDTKQIPDD